MVKRGLFFFCMVRLNNRFTDIHPSSKVKGHWCRTLGPLSVKAIPCFEVSEISYPAAQRKHAGKPNSSTSALWKSQIECIFNANWKQPNLTCRVAWRPSNRPCWPLQHLLWYCCEAQPKSRDAALANWYSLVAASIAAAAICSLIFAFLSIYCPFYRIPIFVLAVRGVRASVCVCVCVSIPFFLPLYLTFLPFDVIISTSFF